MLSYKLAREVLIEAGTLDQVEKDLSKLARASRAHMLRSVGTVVLRTALKALEQSKGEVQFDSEAELEKNLGSAP